MRCFDLRCAVPWVGVLLLLTGSAQALNPELTLKQLNHRAFTASEGAPRDVYALAQTPDGTLWLGGPSGLTRFDGARFIAYPEASDEPLPSANIDSLFATPDGGLWIAFRPTGVSLLKGGHVTNYGEADGLPDGTVAQFALDHDGSVWAVARTALVHLKGNKWEIVASADTIGAPYGVVVDHAGTLWVAGVKGLFALRSGESRLREIDSRKYFSPGGIALAVANDGRIWGASTQGLIYVDGQTEVPRAQAVPGIPTGGGPLLLDEVGNVWLGDQHQDILMRVPSRELTPESLESGIAEPERLTVNEGFKERVLSILQDHEHNLWVGTRLGLHRFSHGNVVRDITPQCTQDLATTGPFVAGDDGLLWIACADGDAAQVIAFRDGVEVSRQQSPEFYVAYRDAQGTIWFAGSNVIAHLDGHGKLITAPLPALLEGRPIQTLARDTSGALWFSESRRTTYRLLNGELSENGNLKELPRTWATVATTDDEGALWFGYTNNRLARVTASTVKLFDAADGLEVGTVTSISAHRDEIWVGGELGFARFNGKRFESVDNASGPPFKGISGIVHSRNGDMWLNGTPGIIHIPSQEVERVVHDPAHRAESEIFNYLDGVPGSAMKLRPLPSAIETSDGRLWFSMTAGIISIDATHLARNTLPPPVTIWALSAGSRRYPNLGSSLQLPIHTTDLQIEYSAGSLTVPERVRFRYKLEGSDSDWQDVGTRREARYTNLGPGRYTFKVIAANNDGVWNKTGASIGLTIAPAFYQTSWFYALCGLACVAVLAALHRVRIHQVASQVRQRLEARLGERERIARELHDTLLQGVQGLIWQFQAAADRIPSDQPVRALMEQSLDRADRLLGESRDRVKDLRPAANEMADLAQALAAEGEHLVQLHPARFRISVQGVHRDLHPIVREDGFLIAREALSNAFQHASAANIEVEVIYRDAELQVHIRDDGQGIGTAVSEEGGRPGHFGLLGMRERAKRLGAHLAIWSKPGAGTEVDLRVPAQVAYNRLQTAGHRGGWRTMFRRFVRQTESTCQSSERRL